MAQLNRASYKVAKNTRFADNNTRDITEEVMRDMHEDTADSLLFKTDDISLNSDFTVDSTKLTDRATIKAFVEANSDKLFLGYYTSEANLISAHATADEGNWAIVDIGIGEPATIYIWDNDDEEWVAGGAAGDFWSLEGTSVFLDSVTIDTDDNDLIFDVGTGKFEILGDFYIKVGAGNTSGVPEFELLPSQAEALRITNGTVDYLTFNTSNGRVEVDQLLRGTFTEDAALTRVLVATTDGDVFWRAASGLSGITSINSLTAATQTIAIGTTAQSNDIGIVSDTATHTIHIPNASTTARGVVNTGSQTFAGVKTFNSFINVESSGGSIRIGLQAGSRNYSYGRGALGSVIPSSSDNIAVGNNALTAIENSAFFNIAIGSSALATLVSGGNNVAIGNSTLTMSTGEENTAVGSGVLSGSASGDSNAGIGISALRDTVGNNNTAIGSRAGRYRGSGTDSLTTADNSVFLGYETRAAANDETNQIVIGYNVVGNGSNSATLGNNSVTLTHLKGNTLVVGNGDANASPRSVAFRLTNASGTDIAGANLTIQGGRSTGDAAGGYIAFETTPAGSAGSSLNTSSEMWRIQAVSSVGALTSNPSFTSVGSGTEDGVLLRRQTGLEMSVNGDVNIFLRRRSSDGSIMSFRRDTTEVGTISVTTTNTAYNTSSDYRLKEDEKPIDNAIELIKALKPYDFKWKSTGTRQFGFYAHELQEVIEYAVTGVKDGEEFQGVDLSKIVPLLAAGLQNLIDRVETLEQ